jgi:cobyrinic acid a,c-diamide synthase
MGSGSGKTILSATLLRALTRRAMPDFKQQWLDNKAQPTWLLPSAFKCGPDFIDPQYLSWASKRAAAHNLDIFLCGENNTKYLLAHYAQDSSFAVIEGVMGLYDGMGQTDRYSSNDVALLTQTPTVLCVSPSGVGFSLAAQIYGFMKFRPNTIKGIILNRCSERMLKYYKPMLEAELGIAVYGALPKLDFEIPSRHLGLFRPDEIADLNQKLDDAADSLENSVDIDAILALGRTAGEFAYDEPALAKSAKPIKIGIVCNTYGRGAGYYEDNLDLLRRLGAQLRIISCQSWLLSDGRLLDDLSGLIILNGNLDEASRNNATMLDAIRAAIAGGMPVIAESEGYEYLCNGFAGVLDVDTFATEQLTRFGYVTLTAQQDSMLCRKGERVHAHEFHYSDSSDNGDAFLAEKPDGRSWPCIHANGNIFAGYPYIHLWGNIKMAERFIEACEAYRDSECGLR